MTNTRHAIRLDVVSLDLAGPAHRATSQVQLIKYMCVCCFIARPSRTHSITYLFVLTETHTPVILWLAPHTSHLHVHCHGLNSTSAAPPPNSLCAIESRFLARLAGELLRSNMQQQHKTCWCVCMCVALWLMALDIHTMGQHDDDQCFVNSQSDTARPRRRRRQCQGL